MASLEVRVEFEQYGVQVSASALAKEITQLTRISYKDALLIVAAEIRRRIQSQSSLWPKPPTPVWIQRKRTGLSQAGMQIHVTGRTVSVVNDVYYARFVNYQRVFPKTGIPNWNYLAVERTLARDWLRIRQRAHQRARQAHRPRPINTAQAGSHGVPQVAALYLLPIIIWDEEEEEQNVASV